MDIITLGPWMLSSQSGVELDVITVGPWMLSSQNGLDHGRQHGWAMDALFSERMPKTSVKTSQNACC